MTADHSSIGNLAAFLATGSDFSIWPHGDNLLYLRVRKLKYEQMQDRLMHLFAPVV
jgi:hypothetical protein